MIVYFHDEGLWDSGSSFGRHRHRSDVHHRSFSKGSPLQGVFDAYNRLAVKGDGLELLVLNAHGASRRVFLGRGIGPQNAESLFKILRPAFDHRRSLGKRTYGVEIHSCAFASNSSNYATIGGYGGGLAAAMYSATGDQAFLNIDKSIGAGTQLMVTIAKAINAPVKASFALQTTDKMGNFEGKWAMAMPNGAVTTYDAGVSPQSVDKI